MKLLITNGCSCTRGEELNAPIQTAWPVLLARRLGVNVVNLARDGSSNRRIVRSTVASLPAVLDRAKTAPSDVMVLICWTQLSRHEYYSEAERTEAGRAVPDGAVDRNWQRIGPWRNNRHHQPSRAFYKHMWSEHGQAVNFLVDWELLDAYLRSRGVHARYTHAFAPSPSIPRALSDVPFSVEPRRAWGGIPNALSHSFEGVASHAPKGPGGHPLEKGHEQFARNLGDWILEARDSDPPGGHIQGFESGAT